MAKQTTSSEKINPILCGIHTQINQLWALVSIATHLEIPGDEPGVELSLREMSIETGTRIVNEMLDLMENLEREIGVRPKFAELSKEDQS